MNEAGQAEIMRLAADPDFIELVNTKAGEAMADLLSFGEATVIHNGWIINITVVNDVLNFEIIPPGAIA